jgi:hypothetical protein
MIGQRKLLVLGWIMEEERMGVGAEMDGNVVRAPKEKKKQKLWDICMHGSTTGIIIENRWKVTVGVDSGMHACSLPYSHCHSGKRPSSHVQSIRELAFFPR